MNCTWEGPRVRDILLAAGLQEHAMQGSVAPKHVHFANYGGKTQADEWYGGSIPLERAMEPAMDVILAVKVKSDPQCLHSLRWVAGRLTFSPLWCR